MNRQSLKFKISQTEDYKTALIFRNMKAGGIDFKKWGIIAPHPALKKHTKLTPKILERYVSYYYKQNKQALRQAVDTAKKEWDKISPFFLDLTMKLFPDIVFPKEKYICYLSIWNCNPRDIVHKTFQIFYKNDSPAETIIHEMLHFFFYAYIYNKYSHYKKKACSKKIWDISETFNVLIMNSEEWQTKLNISKQMPYPEHRKLLEILKKLWKINPQVSFLTDTLLKKRK